MPFAKRRDRNRHASNPSLRTCPRFRQTLTIDGTMANLGMSDRSDDLASTRAEVGVGNRNRTDGRMVPARPDTAESPLAKRSIPLGARSRSAFHFLLAALLSAGLGLSIFAGTAAMTSERASAFCDPTWDVDVHVYAGYQRGREAATYPGTTCNGDNSYSGAVIDDRTDGYCESAEYLEVYLYDGIQGQSCTTGTWSFYTWHDVNGDSAAFIRLDGINNDYWYNTWGY